MNLVKKITSKLDLLLGDKTRINIKKCDFGFSCRINDFIVYSHEKGCITKAYDQIFLNEVYFFRSENNNPLIVDCGANIGLATLYFKMIYPNARIIAIEPSREAYKSLVKNVRENKLTNVVCVNKAVSDIIGTVNFTTNEIISGSIREEKIMDNAYTVETCLLSSFLNEKVDMLKVDIEGAEKMVIPEIADCLQNVDNLFLEFHSFVQETQYLSVLLKTLESKNFRYFIENDSRNKLKRPFEEIPVSLNQDMQLNIWAKRKNVI
ncbi:FkbM family methyltransferase [Roseivirga ehrenbergii]|uniref:Methyltransferase FkbM domain-containing protein n=1 Tax=Roseivirga ehrenbergii (strain DSM 102268 / JCM 13514 / KCTC 12282 / NCIMB 14502 / KMM 6017) TaxID=279360 RepID=A0A150XE93_ROSEK|nr:FkbM family methyltransferase [Roseivirga ehrenbergii]KYG77037.1 hypothetical protein MB14_02215 [Roseivirga ehrenbergii]TCL14461.1 FkbM family methyltransferase [Roseivirga ehrenbergii]